MKIRKVTTADSAAIADIYSRYVEETTISFETTPPDSSEMSLRISAISNSHPYLVSEDETGAIIGYCYAHPWKERAAYSRTWETTIYLSPKAMGNGVGKQLMERLITECRSHGCHALIACITAENTASISFHSSLGFQKVSHFREVGFKFGRYLDVVDMELLL